MFCSPSNSSLAFLSPSVSSTCRSDGLNGPGSRDLVDGRRVEPAERPRGWSSSDRRMTVQYCGLRGLGGGVGDLLDGQPLGLVEDVCDLAVVAATSR